MFEKESQKECDENTRNDNKLLLSLLLSCHCHAAARDPAPPTFLASVPSKPPSANNTGLSHEKTGPNVQLGAESGTTEPHAASAQNRDAAVALRPVPGSPVNYYGRSILVDLGRDLPQSSFVLLS